MSRETSSVFETSDRKESFEDQFARVEKLKVTGGTAEVVDISPDALEDETPVFFAPAWACTLPVYEPALKKLTEEKRRVISLNHPRFGGDMSVAPEEAVQKYPTEELRKAFNLLDVLDQKKIGKADVIAHSEGAVNAVIAAVLNPEKFRSLVLFAPAGLIGEDTFTRLLKGFAAQSKRAESFGAIPATENSPSLPEIPITETERQVGAIAAREALKYLAKNPVRAFREGRDIAKSQIHDMLRYLHEKGVGIVVISGVDDPVFPMDKMQKIAKADMLDGFLSARGGHGALGEHPERYMTAAVEMLAALKKKKEKIVGNKISSNA